MVRLRFLFLLTMAAVAGQALKGFDDVYLKRGEPQREGRAWVEHAECGGAVREGARLVLRADFGSVTVKTGTHDRVECRVRMRVFKPSEEQARLFFRRIELSARTLEGGGIFVSARYPHEHERSGWSSVDFEFTIPQRFNLDLETKGGDVAVGNLEGELHAVTAGGDIQAGDVTGAV